MEAICSPCANLFHESTQQNSSHISLIIICSHAIVIFKNYVGSLLGTACSLTDLVSLSKLHSLTSLFLSLSLPFFLWSSPPTFLHLVSTQEVSHSQDYGEREVLLPLLHLFKEFIRLVSSVDRLTNLLSARVFHSAVCMCMCVCACVCVCVCDMLSVFLYLLFSHSAG